MVMNLYSYSDWCSLRPHNGDYSWLDGDCGMFRAPLKRLWKLRTRFVGRCFSRVNYSCPPVGVLGLERKMCGLHFATSSVINQVEGGSSKPRGWKKTYVKVDEDVCNGGQWQFGFGDPKAKVVSVWTTSRLLETVTAASGNNTHKCLLKNKFAYVNLKSQILLFSKTGDLSLPSPNSSWDSSNPMTPWGIQRVNKIDGW